MAPPEDGPPAIASWSVAPVGNVYLRGALTAEVGDPEGRLTSVVIDWGDQATTTVSTDFDAISRTHDYGRTGAYTIVVTATDAAGNQVTSEKKLTLESAPHGCADIKIIGVCFQTHPDFNGTDVTIDAFGNRIHEYTLYHGDEGYDIVLPVGGPIQQVKLRAHFEGSRTKGRSALRVEFFVCTFVVLCTDKLGEKTFTW